MRRSFSAMSGLAAALESGHDVGVVGQQVVLPERPEAEALADRVGELVVDVGLGRAGPPVPVHRPEQRRRLPRDRQVGEDDRPVDDRQVIEEPRDGLRGRDAAGQAVAEEVVEPVGAQPGQGAFQERIDRIVVELLGRESQRRQGGRDVGAFQELGLEALVVVLLLGGDDEIDRVREGRVGDVVEEARDLLAEVRPQPAQEQVDAQAMLVSGDRLERDRRMPKAPPGESPASVGTSGRRSGRAVSGR